MPKTCKPFWKSTWWENSFLRAGEARKPNWLSNLLVQSHYCWISIFYTSLQFFHRCKNWCQISIRIFEAFMETIRGHTFNVIKVWSLNLIVHSDIVHFVKGAYFQKLTPKKEKGWDLFMVDWFQIDS